jgi:hypothetical protein
MLHKLLIKQAQIQSQFSLILDIGILALALPISSTLLVYANDTHAGGWRTSSEEAINLLESKILPGDVVVLDSYGMPLWHYMMNHWSNPNQWYSLPYAPYRTSELTTQVLSEIINSRENGVERLWILSSGEAADQHAGDNLPEEFDLDAAWKINGNLLVALERYSIRD